MHQCRPSQKVFGVLFTYSPLRNLILRCYVIPHLPARRMVPGFPAPALSSHQVGAPTEPALFRSWRNKCIVRQDGHAHLDRKFCRSL
jgi:hypothetical protein